MMMEDYYISKKGYSISDSNGMQFPNGRNIDSLIDNIDNFWNEFKNSRENNNQAQLSISKATNDAIQEFCTTGPIDGETIPVNKDISVRPISNIYIYIYIIK